jgi:hypothetical protein
MKRIYMALALGVFAFSASAQRSIDLEMLHAVPSTIVIDSVNLSNTVIAWGIVNHGPDNLLTTDTVKWSTPSGTYYYKPTVAVAMGDTLGFTDTLQFTDGPADGPIDWCDSVWSISSTASTITDPVPANNKVCTTVTIDNRNGATGIFTNGLVTASLAIYPNPASDKVNFKYTFPKSSEVSVRITDIAGRTALTKDFGKQAQGEKEFMLDISALQNGVYYIELISDNKRAINKLTIRK